jgi:hypothetical protein
MRRRDEDRRADRLLARLRAALRDEGDPAEPPADRVRELRAQADAHRARAVAAAGSSARPPPSLPRRRFLALGGLAASAGAAVALGGRALLDDDDQPLPPTETIALTGAPDGVRASAKLINHTWGVELLLTVSGLPPGRRYDTVYRATDGRELLAGSFLGTGREALCRMNGALLRDELATIEVRRPDGEALLRSQLA